MEKVFSLSSVRFDHCPEDSELVCLLGDSDCAGSIEVVDTPESLVARPGLLRMKYLVPWMLFVASVITVATWIARHFGGNVFSDLFVWVLIGMTWLLVLPAFFGLLAIINHSFAKKGDYFRVDKSGPTLQLCQVAKIFNASDILAFTELSRWCRYGHVPWGATRQTGVLVRAADGHVELYPVFRELEENIPVLGRRLPLTDRLAQIFRVPVRRMKLDRPESQSLGDC
jgi:hypothetical protein